MESKRSQRGQTVGRAPSDRELWRDRSGLAVKQALAKWESGRMRQQTELLYG